MKTVFPIIVATAFAILLWQMVVSLTGLPRFTLPSPLLVIETWWQNRMLILEHLLVTATSILIGLRFGQSNQMSIVAGNGRIFLVIGRNFNYI